MIRVIIPLLVIASLYIMNELKVLVYAIIDRRAGFAR
jgi:hypothetical protein